MTLPIDRREVIARIIREHYPDEIETAAEGCADAIMLLDPPPNLVVAELVEGLQPLVKIADAYDANGLDDEARKFWGANDEHSNLRDPAKIELYASRGGRTLLTLADCLKARAAQLVAKYGGGG